MSLNRISTDAAPAAIGPYAQAVQVGNLLFCSGQLPVDPTSGELVADSIGKATEQIIQNLQAVLTAGGSDLAHVVKTTVFLADINDFAAMNEAYGKYFGEKPPARACVEVARLPKDAPVEIEAIAEIIG